MSSAAWIAALGLGLGLGLGACGGQEGASHPGRGVVEGVDTQARRVTLDHEDIEGLMKAMTMTFEVAPEVDLEGIMVGDAVEFKVKEERGVYTVTELHSAGP